jgi:hypothetical protein
MFLDESITVSVESVRRFGPTGAIVLQVLYTNFNEAGIPLNIDEWCSQDNILYFIQSDIVKRTLTALATKGLITIEDDILIFDAPQKKRKERKQKKEEKREPNDTWKMAQTIISVLKLSGAVASVRRYLPFATKLLAAGVTVEDMVNWYGDDGWWYKNEYKGATFGDPPTQTDITRTLDLARAGYTRSLKKAVKTNKDDFFS